MLATAAGVVFFGLLAVFPAVTALVSSYGLFADPATIGANLQTLALMLPEGSFQIVQDQIARVLAKGTAALGGTFLFGLALALWSANAGVKAIIDALNVVYEVRETRSFIRLNLLSLALTTGGIVALLLMVSAVVAFPLAFNHLGLQPESRFILGLARWPLLFAVLLVGAERALPVRTEPACGAVGMAGRRHARRGAALDRRLRRVVLVPLEFRQLQRDLRLAWRRHRPDDVDVDVGHRSCCSGPSSTRKSSVRPRPAAHAPHCRDSRRASPLRPAAASSGRVKRTLALRINIDAKVARARGAQGGPCLKLPCFPG